MSFLQNLVTGVVLFISSLVTMVFGVQHPTPSVATVTTSATILSDQNNSLAPQIQFSTPDYKLFSESGYSEGSIYMSYSFTYVIAGVLTSGKYKGYHLVVAYEETGTPDTSTYLFATKDFKTFVVDTSKSIDSYSDAAQSYKEGAFNAAIVVGADSLSIQKPPAIIDEGNFALINRGFSWYSFRNLATASSTALASSVPNLWFFANEDTTIAVETAEGLVFDYVLISKESAAYAAIAASSTPPVTDNGFYKKTDFVTSASTYESYGEPWLQNNLSQDDLTPIVQTKRGVQLYTFKKSNTSMLQQGYDSTITGWVKESGSSTIATTTIPKLIGSIRVPVPIPTFEQYVAQNPILFFKDPWGRWIGIEELDYPYPYYGKGKPVIYLYPKKTEKVSVKVDPVGGFTKTDPVYGNGWNVMATPDSRLTNLSDGKTYPYLFWEGGAKGVVNTPKEGFVVAQADIPALLSNKLALLGLNAKERTDFMSFWVSRLSKAPYYFITFVPKSEMDRVAPLTVVPTPDTVIRVLMDYKALSVPISVSPLPITTPVRNGFTVVEWGGIIRD